ncbi:MAG: exodeoxyribonuclease V subunit alpha [Desulfobacteraceae bacterium]|nr:MAG: exodeoxyribonuclease V subunit alpha [Desulfobacteraceae bacterium]
MTRTTASIHDKDPLPDPILERLIDFKIIKESDKGSIEPLLPLFRFMEISFLDLMTLRDLLEFGDCRGDASLVVVLTAMFAGLEEGSLCLNIDPGHFLRQVPEKDRIIADAVVSEFHLSLAAGRYQKLITQNVGEYMPLILDRSSGGSLLYFQKHHAHEKRLKDRMEAFLNQAGASALEGSDADELIEEIYTDPLVLRFGRNKSPIARDPQQMEAIRLALKSSFSIVSGGPGTGKTSLMVNILRCLVRSGIPASRILLAAPTGRAAQRMTETVQKNIASIQRPSSEDSALMGQKGSTLHKILGYRSFRNDFFYCKSNPLPAAAVVVDEVSMVDMVMLDKFLQAIDPAHSKLILLGDKNQLPSVEAGAVFAEMIPDARGASRFKGRFVVLQKVYRSGARLLELANQVNRGTFPAFRAVSFTEALAQAPDRWAFVDAEDPGKWKQHLHRWAAYQYLDPVSEGRESYVSLIAAAEKTEAGPVASSEPGRSLLDRIFSVVERARILSFLRSGIYGCTGINEVVSDVLIRRLDPPATRLSEGFSGAIIIITRNDYSKELFNGDVGVMIKDANRTYRAFFHRSDFYISFPVNLLPSWEFAFAVTVHKSQGSEFDDVLLVFPDDENHRLLTREIVYTGITRAKKRVVLYGRKGALDTALARKIQRQSGLMW